MHKNHVSCVLYTGARPVRTAHAALAEAPTDSGRIMPLFQVLGLLPGNTIWVLSRKIPSTSTQIDKNGIFTLFSWLSAVAELPRPKSRTNSPVLTSVTSDAWWAGHSWSVNHALVSPPTPQQHARAVQDPELFFLNSILRLNPGLLSYIYL